jgi:16S rRNA (cytosine967-C5)-methyltransferase
MSVNARETVLRALTALRLHQLRSEEALNAAIKKDGLDPRDASLCARIFYGVLQNRLFIDDCIAAYSSVKLPKLHPQVLDILRLSVYQLLFLSKIPVNAAVNEGVTLTRKNANPRAAGLVNAVLRRVTENRESLLSTEGESLTAEGLSRRYSHPLWLVNAFVGRLGLSETAALLQTHNEDAPLTVRVNTLRTDAQQATKSLEADGAEVQTHWLDGSLELRNVRRLDRLAAFQNGGIYVQDPAAALAVTAAEPKPGMLIIDGCASPGGKSIAAGILMGNKGRIISCDVTDKKLERIQENADRAGMP